MDLAPLAFEILGGILVGASLGLIGAGGAILSVPIFALVLGHATKVASLEALVVTGVIASFSAVRAAMDRRVDFRRALAFAVPGTLGAWMGAPLGQMLPEVAHAMLFALLAAVASWRMVAHAPREPGQQGERGEHAGQSDRKAIAIAGLVGLAIGILTSVIGVGGGFLLIPALVLVLRLRMPIAIGTSLFLIAVNCAIALLSHLRHSEESIDEIDWPAVAIVAACGIVGSTLGSRIGARLSPTILRRSFAVVLVLVGTTVLLEGLGVFTADR